MEIYTIGFAKKSAREFFGLLRSKKIKRLVDVRLNNVSQLTGFTKRGDLQFFLDAICHAEYLHKPDLAPTKEILDAYKKKQIAWEEYEIRFRALLMQRKAENLVERELFEAPTVLLCSEPDPDCCHRRLVAEYLREKWDEVTIRHL